MVNGQKVDSIVLSKVHCDLHHADGVLYTQQRRTHELLEILMYAQIAKTKYATKI